MKRDQLDQIIRDAVTAGILPVGAARPVQDSRPWPVVLLTALGAWLAVLPLLIVTGLLLGDWISRGPGSYLMGALVLLGALLILRFENLALFAEQLAVSALLVGGATLGFGLFRDLPQQGAAALLALSACAVAAMLPRPWLRVLLGALAAALAALAFLPDGWASSARYEGSGFWGAWHACFLLWLVASWMQRDLLRRSAALESFGAGWILATLAGLALWSGMTFLLGAGFGAGIAGDLARESGRSSGYARLLQAASGALAAAAALRAGSAWPGLRQIPAAAVALILIVLAWFMPSLGAVLLALSFCATSARWRVAAAAISAAAWIIGSFYYQLHWPLATKAALLAGAGAVLGALAWLGWRRNTIVPPVRGAAQACREMPLGIAACAVAVLVAANSGIWQKEDLIAHGRPVYVELAPVDPRSLMQGDYMQLDYRMPREIAELSGGSARRPRAVARRDANGVATLLRIDQGAALAFDEFLFELTPKNGRWTLVSDAWFFKEGEAGRWAGAKYGEFRVTKDGRALLVGLRGPGLEKL